MKKLLSLVLGAMFMITACNKNTAETFAGKEYKLADANPGVEITLGFAANEAPPFSEKPQLTAILEIIPLKATN